MRKDEIGHAKVEVKMSKNLYEEKQRRKYRCIATKYDKLIGQNCKIFKNDGDSRRC